MTDRFSDEGFERSSEAGSGEGADEVAVGGLPEDESERSSPTESEGDPEMEPTIALPAPPVEPTGGGADDSPIPAPAPIPTPITPGTAGCGQTAEVGVRVVQVSVNGVLRTFLLSVPDGYEPTRPTALIMTYHGACTPSLTEDCTGMGRKSREGLYGLFLEEEGGANAVYVYPEGTEITPTEIGWNSRFVRLCGCSIFR